MTHADKVSQWLGPLCRRRGQVDDVAVGTSDCNIIDLTPSRDFGVEIGAFQTPVPGIRPYYVDRFKEYANARCVGDYWGDAGALPFHSHSLDYVVTSHVLEHVANPVAALFEWTRVARHGGILYMVLPDRRSTFDHSRELTPPGHMMEDFRRGTTNADGTHVGEYLERMDWSRFLPGATPEETAATRDRLRVTYTAAVEHHLELNFHFHVFEPSNLAALIGLMNRYPQRPGELAIVDTVARFPDDRPDGFLTVLRVRKPLPARWAGWRFRRRAGGDAGAALLPDARPLFET